MTILEKNPIVTVRMSSKYASVIINLILTSATQLYNKITKINEIFIVLVTPHFFLKLIQKQSSSFEGPLWLHTKTNSCQLSHLNRLSGLHRMSLIHRKEFRGTLGPPTLSQEHFFFKKKFFFPSSYNKRMHWGQCCSDLVT